jgi:hypothetical protein
MAASKVADGLVVYLVSSEEQGAAVRQGIAELHLIWAEGPLPPVVADIIVAGSPTETAALAAYRDANEIRAALGESLIPLMDATR